jgi:Uma2 family endonuclease
MAIASDQKIWTDEEFMVLPEDERCELVNGEVVNIDNSGMEHGWIASILNAALFSVVQPRELGVICDSSTAFSLKSGNKRSPDLSFIAKERLQGVKRLPRGYFQASPDLAVEILSPTNTVEEIHDKIVEYFENDTRLVWVIHPDEQYVLVYHNPSPDRLLRLQDELTAEDVIPEFVLPVAALFTELEF